MKTNLKVLVAIMALGAVILLCLHIFLLYGLTRAMRDVVLPRVKAETGVDVRVGRLSINIPGGILYLKRVEVRNPDGFLLENLASVDRVEVEVDILSLFKKDPILVNNITVENALLNVIRSKDGRFNITRLQTEMQEQSVRPPVEREPSPAVEMPEQRKIPKDTTPAMEPEQREVPETVPVPAQPMEPKPLPEVLIEAITCDVKVRYLDFRLDQLDLALDLGISGCNLSTQRDPSVPWADLAIIGSLGDDRTRFITDLKLRLAPLTDPSAPSLDLTGKVMEIDPRIMEEAYSKLGIRSAPFGLVPVVHCREGLFEDSSVSLNLRDIEMEDKLSDRLGGMGRVESLRFPVPVEGSIQEPVIDVQGALLAAIGGGNARSLLDAFLKGAAAKEAGLETPPESMTDAAVELLGEHVEEIGENEALKEDIKSLGKWLFGK